jgi:hypothetical protein
MDIGINNISQHMKRSSEYLSYNQYVMSWTTEESEFDSRLGKDYSLSHHVRFWGILRLLDNYYRGGGGGGFKKRGGRGENMPTWGGFG